MMSHRAICGVLTLLIAASTSAFVDAAENMAAAKKAPAKAKRAPPGRTETLACRLGTEDRHARIAVVVIRGKTDSFAYYSKWKPRTCSVYLQRKGDMFSRWADNGNITTVSLENSHCIATIALTPENQVIVARQFRPGPEKILDEIPGGGVEAHDDGNYEAAARRELQEETGYVAGAMEYLGDVYKDSYNNTTWHFYLATDCTLHKYGQTLDETEHIDVHLISIDQLLDNARSARMTDPEAVLLAYERLAKLGRES